MIEKCHVIDHLELAGIFSIQMCKIMDSFEKGLVSRAVLGKISSSIV